MTVTKEDLNNLAGNLGDIADNLYTVRDFTWQMESTLATTNILLGIIAISLIAMTILKFLELKKQNIFNK